MNYEDWKDIEFASEDRLPEFESWIDSRGPITDVDLERMYNEDV